MLLTWGGERDFSRDLVSAFRLSDLAKINSAQGRGDDVIVAGC